MLQQLPLEIITHIASFIPLEQMAEFASTCQMCYFAVLPHVWHHLSIHNLSELDSVAQHLQSNRVWAQRVIQFVRKISLCSDQCRYSPKLAATMFGMVSTPPETKEQQESMVRKRLSTFGCQILALFPHVSHIVFDFVQAIRLFDMDTPIYRILPFYGSVSLVNYASDHTLLMHYLLSPFREMRQLKIQATPVVSLCDDLDASLLTEQDIRDIASLSLTCLQRLELSYLDANTRIETLQALLETLPHLDCLQLTWLFPLKDQPYKTLCQAFKEKRFALTMDSHHSQLCFRFQ
ncbi:uncharacterized protein B0P05DRAFT_590881 [Gilbertella persicaria]|uniref:F-box domain-containing protein n=1 Tax=Rhizopus stolonifer TaxID=4846 RepID=A0A367KWL3_RHIST|nr:uncharacterized protein B0P05DRAFT_590881 [Gilbertella persicaria]KAI8059946.1 hypothetical protein B0P05DRAFT_590881 [Gilbertella persicaria]RCI06599.1 hypothetical protein CU098_013240 [Rhizopus stolonifer]